jgi:hypothetical protein
VIVTHCGQDGQSTQCESHHNLCSTCSLEFTYSLAVSWLNIDARCRLLVTQIHFVAMLILTACFLYLCGWFRSPNAAYAMGSEVFHNYLTDLRDSR